MGRLRDVHCSSLEIEPAVAFEGQFPPPLLENGLDQIGAARFDGPDVPGCPQDGEILPCLGFLSRCCVRFGANQEHLGIADDGRIVRIGALALRPLVRERDP